MNILTIGGATQDVCVYYQHQEIAYFDTPSGKQRFLLLLEGAKIELERVAYLSGGGAHNAAVSYARQGFNTRIVCCVGSDCQGDFIVDNLAKNSVSTDFVVRTSLTTGFSFVITLTTGDRTVLVNRGANLALASEHVPDAALDGIDQLYITSLTGSTSALLPAFALRAQQRGIPVAVNPGSSQLRADGYYLQQSLSSIDTLILNSYEATLFMGSLQQAQSADHQSMQGSNETNLGTDLPELAQKQVNLVAITPEQTTVHATRVKTVSVESNFGAGCPESQANDQARGSEQLQRQSQKFPFLLSQESNLDLRLFCSSVHSHGTKIVVVTNGAEGVYVSTDECLYFYPSQPIKVVSTLGAGDAFGSGFVGHLARDGTVQEAIRYGIANSHAVLSDYGAQTGLLSADALAQAAQALDPMLLQKYSL